MAHNQFFDLEFADFQVLQTLIHEKKRQLLTQKNRSRCPQMNDFYDNQIKKYNGISHRLFNLENTFMCSDTLPY